MTPSPGKKIRVLHVIESLGRAGAEQVLVNLLPTLQKMGIQNEVAVLWEPLDLKPTLEEKGIPVHSLRISYKWNLPEALWKLGTICWRGDFQIIHCNLFFAELYSGLLGLFFPEIKRVTTFHNLGYESFPATTYWKKLRKALDAFIKRKSFCHFFSISKAVGKSYQKHLGITKPEVIYNPLSEEFFADSIPGAQKEEVKAKWGVRPDEFVLIMVGRCVREKGHQILLDSLVQLRHTDRKLKLILIGNGPLFPTIQLEIEKKKLTDRIVVFEHLPRKDLKSAIEAADCFVLPSLFEGFGLAAAEAMALGTPVIVSSAGGLPEVVEDGISGLIAPAGDSQKLAEAIGRVMDSPQLLERLSIEGKKRIQKFRPEIIAGNILKSYQRLLSNA